MFVINAGIENGNNNFFTAFRVRPRVQGVEIDRDAIRRRRDVEGSDREDRGK